MEPYMFTNGLPILFYCDHESLLRIRQLSKAMRKRVFYIVRDKIVKVNKNCQNRAKNLNGWVYLTSSKQSYSTDHFQNLCKLSTFPELITQRVADTEPSNQAELISISKNFPELRCSLRSKSNSEIMNCLLSSFQFKRVSIFECTSTSTILLENNTFDQIDDLRLKAFVYTEKEREAISRIKKVLKASISMDTIDLSQANWTKSLQILELNDFTVGKEVELPCVTQITVRQFVGLSKLKCPQLETLVGSSPNTDLELTEIAGFASLKRLTLRRWAYEGKEALLPRGLKHLWIYHKERSDPIDVKAVLKQCPGLISFHSLNHRVDLVDVEGSSLREVCLLGNTKLIGKSSLRLKRITIDDSNYSLLHQHPEIISEAKHFKLSTFSFDWNFLPDGLKMLWFDEATVIGEAVISKFIEKLRGSKIKTISVETAASAREIVKIAAEVEEIRCDDQFEELETELKEFGCELEPVAEDATRDRCSIF